MAAVQFFKNTVPSWTQPVIRNLAGYKLLRQPYITLHHQR